MYQTIFTGLDEGILTVTINRPDKLNALNRQVLQELDQVMDEVYANDKIRSVILTGAGPKAFVAGADIAEFASLPKEDAIHLSTAGQAIFFKIEDAPKPVVAAVNGFALGGGCELAMACHFRIASTQAKFGQPEVNLGLIPGYGGTQRLPQLIGKGRAIELLISGGMIDAQKALQYGLVNEVVEPDALLPRVRSIMQTIQSKAPLAVAMCIRSANLAFEKNAREAYRHEAEAFGACFGTEDQREGVSAFTEKRQPVFKGR